MPLLFTLGAIIAWIGIAAGIASLIAWVFLYLNGEIADEDDRILGDWPNVPRELRPARKLTREDVARASGRADAQGTLRTHSGSAS